MKRSTAASLKVECGAEQTIELPSGHFVSAKYGGNTYTAQLREGFYAEQANKVWQATSRKLAEGEYDDLDLRTFAGLDIGRGPGRDAFGDPMVLDEVVLLEIRHTGGDGRLELMRSTPLLPVRWCWGGSIGPRGILAMCNPAEDAYDVLDDQRNLRVHAIAGDVEYSILIVGRKIEQPNTGDNRPQV